MFIFSNEIPLPRCPHCNVATPTITKQWEASSQTSNGLPAGMWGAYKCRTCGFFILVHAVGKNEKVLKIYPEGQVVDESVPTRAKAYLEQAIESKHAPAGAIMLAASSIDAMLKAQGYIEGNLYPRINQAASDHLITDGMKTWAHQVRLEANDQRHADADAELPTQEQAEQVIEFAIALAQFLFVLPARVTMGIDATGPAAPPAS